MSQVVQIGSHNAREESKQQLREVQNSKNDPNGVIEPLQKLCVSLVMGVERYLRGFDSAAAIPMLTRMSWKEVYAFHGDAITLIFRALTLILEYAPSAHGNAIAYHKELIKSVCQILARTLAGKMKYSHTDNVMLLEESIRLIRFISKDEYNISILRFGIGDVVRVAASENTLLARQAFETLCVICSKVILPSEGEKTSIFSSLFQKGKKKTAPTNPASSDKPNVVAVETIIVPFLQTTIQQYVASLGSFPEAWSFLEMALQCLGILIQRAMLCRRPSTARKMVTSELFRTLFRLLLFIDADVALEPSVRSDRVLFCETFLDAAIMADWTLAGEALLAEEAKSFFKLVLEESASEFATLLEDPFPRGGMSSRSTQRRDKNHTTSIAAIRLLVLACPRVPLEAFGPKPKVLLPVHQWHWEDEMRHNNKIDEEECVSLESSWARLSKDASIRVHTKSLSIDIHSMKISRGFGATDRNISRKFVPFVFHFVDEANLRLPKSAKEVMASNSLAVSVKKESKTSNEKGIGQLYILNKDCVVGPTYMYIAEMYLESLCNFAVSVSGQMAKQLATCACAALLQAAICSKQEKSFIALMRKTMRPLCEMIREALVSADKATKSVALIMMVWLLHHPRASEWKFSETAQRCGILFQLENTARTASAGSNKKSLERRQTRTEYLAETASTLLHVISEKIPAGSSTNKTFSRNVADITVVRNAVNNLMECSNTPGTHAKAISDVLIALKQSAHTLTPFEVSKLGLSEAVLNYLLGVNYSKVIDTFGESTNPAVCVEGVRTRSYLHEQCNGARLACFVQCSTEHPEGVQSLVENLISVLPLITTFTLVESVTRSGRVMCRSPLQAILACTRISPPVSLCSKMGGTILCASVGQPSSTPRDRSRSPSAHNPKEYCPNGHKLQFIASNPNLCLCDLCEREVRNGFRCAYCDFDMCNECFTNTEIEYEGGSPLTSPANGESHAGKIPSPSRTDLLSLRAPARAHLFSTVGDIERYFRTGTTSTKHTDTAPAPPSALHNVDLFMDRANSVLERIKADHGKDFSRVNVRQSIQNILTSFSLRNALQVASTTASDGNTQSVDSLFSCERDELNVLLRDAIEERYVLYTTGCGRNPYHLTLLGSMYQNAFTEGQISLLEQLENCLLHQEGSTENADGSPTSSLLEVRSETHVNPLSLDTSEVKYSKSRLYIFHHFESDTKLCCACGQKSRVTLNTVQVPKLQRKLTPFSTRTEVLLLILLHKVLSPMIQKGIIDMDLNAFESAPVTTFVVKSVAASALRVAVLPRNLAVPRWVDFVLKEARFFLCFNVRERLARFFAYGARRALWKHLKSAHLTRPDRSIKLYPAEWARLANHKYRVSRDYLLHDAFVILCKSAESRFPISIEFEGDVGVGQGPTAHFYTLVAKQLQKAKLRLWRGMDSTGVGEEGLVVPSPEGLYPRPITVSTKRDPSRLETQQPPKGGETLRDLTVTMEDFMEFQKERARFYYLIGAALGRAFVDQVVFPLDLSPALGIFLRESIPPVSVVLRNKPNFEAYKPVDLMALTIDDAELMDKKIADSLRSLASLSSDTLASLELPFTLPGDDTMELLPDGAKKRVNAQNLSTYTRRAVSALLYESVVFPLRFIVHGFRDVVPCDALAPLGAKETMNLLCGCATADTRPLWTAAEIQSILVPDHGYQKDSPQLQMLGRILADRFTPMEQRLFLLFCTGCPRLPAGGVRALGAITVVKRSDFGMPCDLTLDDTIGGGTRTFGATGEADWPLPSVNTCFRYLKLPPYPSEELMYKKLRISITQSGETFELS